MINKIYKSVLITGAADGIGLETLKRVFKEKIDVYALDKNITKLKKLQNVFITPHIAGLSDNNRERGYNIIKQNLYRYLNNQELLNIVDKKREY